MLSVANKPIMMSVFMLSVVMLSVIILNVVAPAGGEVFLRVKWKKLAMLLLLLLHCRKARSELERKKNVFLNRILCCWGSKVRFEICLLVCSYLEAEFFFHSFNYRRNVLKLLILF